MTGFETGGGNGGGVGMLEGAWRGGCVFHAFHSALKRQI